MKWFKVDSGFEGDEKVVELIDAVGPKGFLLYMVLLSQIASRFNGNPDPDQTFKIHESSLRQASRMMPARLQHALSKIQSIFNLEANKKQSIWHFSYPKFVEKQRSYFNVSRQKRDIVTHDKNRIEVDKNKNNTYAPNQKNSGPVPPHKRIKLNKKTWEWEGWTEEDVPSLKEAYPGVNHLAELKRMALWVKANPAKRSKMNWYRFALSWFSRTQERANR